MGVRAVTQSTSKNTRTHMGRRSIDAKNSAAAGRRSGPKDRIGLRGRIRNGITHAVMTGTSIKFRIGDTISTMVDIEELDLGLEQVEKVIGIIEPLLEKRTSPLAWVRAAAALGKFCIKTPDNASPEDYFYREGRDWERAFEGELAHIIFTAVKPAGECVRSSSYTKIFSGHEEKMEVGAYIGTIPGLQSDAEVAWLIGAFNKVEAIFFREQENIPALQQEILELASEAFWSARQTNNLVLHLVGDSYGEMKPSLVDDDARTTHRSQLSDNLIAGARQYLQAGINWTYMLYGPPGSGKSTAAARLVFETGLRSLRLPVETLHRLDADDMDMIFRVVKPEAVIMDDFDRCGSQEIMLERMEKMRREAKLVICTANNPNDLDEAILRPGRIDEWVEIDRLDEDAIRSILGDFADDSFELVKTWPVAFIESYVTRRRVRNLSATEAHSSMVELARRVKRMRRVTRPTQDIDQELDIIAGDTDPVEDNDGRV